PHSLLPGQGCRPSAARPRPTEKFLVSRQKALSLREAKIDRKSNRKFSYRRRINPPGLRTRPISLSAVRWCMYVNAFRQMTRSKESSEKVRACAEVQEKETA